MKQIALTFIILTLTFIQLYAADDNVTGEEPLPSSVQIADDVREGVEQSLDETITETVAESVTERIVEIITEATDENFIPSIQITEDLPVAFPVDI